MVNLIMLYVFIGMAIMYYITVTAINYDMDNSGDYFKNTPLYSLFLVGLIWPIIIICAFVQAMYERFKEEKNGIKSK